jgi:hypothetical protein
MKYLAYMNILFGDNRKTMETVKKGDALKDHSGIKNQIKKIPVD